MPIYEYQCEACGHRSEAIQRLAEEPLSECAECGGSIRRLISAPAVQFKGSGWYVTDYGGRKVSEQGSDDSSTKEAASTTESGAKSESATSAKSAKSTKSKAAPKTSE